MSARGKARRLQNLKDTVLRVATHYTWAFVIVMALTVVSSAFSVSYLATLETNLNEVYENNVRGGDTIETAYTALLRLESTAKDLVLYPDKASRERAKSDIQDLVSTLRAAVARAVPRFHTPKARQAMVAAQVDLKLFLGALEDNLGLTEGKRSLAAADLKTLVSAAGTLEKDFDLLLANRSANSNIGVSELVFQLRFSLVFTIVLLVVTVVVRLVMYWAGHPARQRSSPQ